MRRRNPIYGFDYFTSDGRYKASPMYAHARYGGRTPRIEQWALRDLQNPETRVRYYPRLDDIRLYYCAPDGKVPWLVCDMDDGVLRVEPDRAAAARWGSIYAGDSEWRFRRTAAGSYECFYGPRSEESASLFIMRGDVAHHAGFDPLQQPLHPFPDDPFEQVDRPVVAEESG